MTEHGCSKLFVGSSGIVLDRIAGLEKVISSEQVRQALSASNRTNHRRCILSHEVMMRVVIAMGLFTDVPIRQVFRRCRRFHEDETTPVRSSLCEARQRLGAEPVRQLHGLVTHPLATPDTPGAFYKGLRWMAIDGTLLDVFESEANSQAFERPSNSGGKAAFPQVRKVSLVEVGTHAEVAIAVGGFQVGETTLARQLWDKIPPDALLMEDRGFFCFRDWIDLHNRGIKLLIRLKKNIHIRVFRTLKDGSCLAKVYLSEYDRKRDRNGTFARLIEYTLDDPQRTGYREKHRLLTNLLDEEEFPALELIEGYHERWEHELTYDEQKTHQDPIRAEKPANLRSETPEGVMQEIYALSLAHFVIRSMMFEAASIENLDPDRLSFKGCFEILECRLPECDPRSCDTIAAWYCNVLQEFLQERIPPRRNRNNPRVVKRQQSPWPKKRPKHRSQKPLTKTFSMSVVMAN